MTTKKKFILGFSLVSLVAIGFIVFRVYSDKTQPLSTPSPLSESATYKDLRPGVSSIDDVTASLGQSIDTREQNGAQILEYRSNNPNFNSEAVIEEQKLAFIRQIVTMEEQITISQINEKYGNYEYVLYGELSTNGFDLYIYPGKGVAYIGHQSSGIILEIWYFPPTTLEGFKSKYAQDYSDSLQPHQ